MNLYLALAAAVLTLHLAWIVWVALGWLLTRSRPWLRAFHILSLLYSIVIELGPWWCPLTLVEQWAQSRAGMEPYRDSFLIHYLEALVYPNVSEPVLAWAAAGFCALILGVYGLRFRRRRIAAFSCRFGSG